MTYCECCRHEYSEKNWAKHLKTKKHKRNDEDPAYIDFTKAEKHNIASKQYYEFNWKKIAEKRKEKHIAFGIW
jgi:hypothetical protein